MRRLTCATASLALALLAIPGGTARAEGVLIHFLGPHPVDPDLTRAMCHIEGPHLHAYQPHKQVLYVKVGPDWAFIGDPVEFDAGGPRHAYYGHHPAFWIDDDDEAAEPEHYCYISGPHHHWYAPPPRLSFKVKGGVYWYVGAHPSWYKQRRPQFRAVDSYYATVQYERPVVTVTPPEGFVGVVVGPGGVVAGAVVRPPSVRINLPIPSVDIVLGGGGGPGYYHGHGGPRYKYKRKYKYKHGHGYDKHRGPPHYAPAWGRRGKGKRWH